MVSALGVIKTTKGGWSDVETTYNILTLRERWGLAADCEDHGLVNSGRTAKPMMGRNSADLTCCFSHDSVPRMMPGSVESVRASRPPPFFFMLCQLMLSMHCIAFLGVSRSQ